MEHLVGGGPGHVDVVYCKFARFMGGISLITREVRSLWGSNAMPCGP
jgi:hypothetical protein